LLLVTTARRILAHYKVVNVFGAFDLFRGHLWRLAQRLGQRRVSARQRRRREVMVQLRRIVVVALLEVVEEGAIVVDGSRHRRSDSLSLGRVFGAA